MGWVNGELPIMKSALLCLGLITLVKGQTTLVSSCIYQGNAAVLPINAYIVGCTTPPCVFSHGDDAIIQIIFRSPRIINEMETLAYAYILGPIGSSYPLGEEAVTCNFLTNTYCPLLQGEVVQYALRMAIEDWMPSASVTVEFVIRDLDTGGTVACARVPIRVGNTRAALDSRGTLNNTSGAAL